MPVATHPPSASAGSSPVCKMNESRAGVLRSRDSARCKARQAMRSGMLLAASGITPRHVELLVVSSAFQVNGFSRNLSRGTRFASESTRGRQSVAEVEMLKDAMKLERWVAVISLLLVLLLAGLGWR